MFKRTKQNNIVELSVLINMYSFHLLWGETYPLWLKLKNFPIHQTEKINII